VRVAGRDVPNGIIDLGPDGVHDVVVRFTNTPNEIRGTIRDASGKPAPDAAVVLFPADERLWNSFPDIPASARLIRTVSAEYRATFLPVGEYFVVAVDDAQLDGWPNARLAALLAAKATRVSVGPAQHLTVDLTFGRNP
jgi:hypothetical protein